MTAAAAPTAPSTALHRKLGLARPLAGAVAMTPARALAQAVARLSQALQLPVEVVQAADSVLTLPELTELVEENALAALVEGPAGARGLCALAPGVLAGLIEVQTTGRVARSQAAARRPTRTDAAMCATSIDQMLGAFSDALDPVADRVWAHGYRYGAHLDDLRPLPLFLEEPAYRVLRALLDLGEGARQGMLTLALPAEGRAAPPEPSAVPVPGPATQEWSAGLARAVMSAPAVLEAILHRMPLTLAEVLALQPGQVLTLPGRAIDSVRLEGAGGVLSVCTARLGRLNGHRALCLGTDEADPPDHAFEPRPVESAAPRTPPAAALPRLSPVAAD